MFSDANDPSPGSSQPTDVAAKLDREAGHALSSGREHAVIKSLAKLGGVGDQGPLYFIGSVVTVAGLLKGDRRCASAGLSMIAAVAGADVMKSAIKNRVKRSRPDHSMEEGEYKFETGGSPDKEEQSFPSGHVACSVAAAGAVSAFYPGSRRTLGWATAFIALSRVAKGRHWPSDLIAGLAVGSVSHRFVSLITPRCVKSCKDSTFINC